jgi:hypothetical protein
VTRDPRTGALPETRATTAPGLAQPPGPSPAAERSAASPFQPYQTYATGSWPEAVAIGDVNGDGRDDIALVTSYYFDSANDYSLHIFIQDVDGALEPRIVRYLGGDPESVAIGDVNGDGRKDVVVGLNSAIGVLTQNAGGTLDPMYTLSTSDSNLVRVADLDHDGRQDVVGAGWGTNTVTVFLQQMTGSLGTPVVYSAQHGGYDDLEVGDVNGDTLTDTVIMSGQLYGIPNLSVLYQQPDGTLGGLVTRNIGTNQLAGGVGVGDVTGDGRSDVALGMNWAGGGTPALDILPQQPDGSLPAAPTQSLPMGYPEPVEVGDLTGDGRGDVIAFDGYSSSLALFRQSATGLLGAKEAIAFPYATHLNRHGIAIGDVNSDGANDVVVANYNYGLVVYRNIGPQVVIAAPSGQIVVGTPITIQWAAGGATFDSFDVSYSVDGGVSYAAVPGCTSLPASAVSCLWASPGPVTSAGRVKVVGKAAGGAELATGVVSISIEAPVLTVTSPDTALVWPAGESRSITWTTNVTSSPVKIELTRDGGVTWATLVESAVNSGSYAWMVTNPTTNAARVRVSSTTDPALTDTSDVSFTIDRPPVANAGLDVAGERGEPIGLSGAGSWDPDGDPLTYTWSQGPTVIATTAAVVVAPPLGTTSFTLEVMDLPGLFSTDTVTVQVTDTTPPTVIVVSPVAGTQLEVGQPVTLEWTATDNGALSRFDVSGSRDLGATYTPIPGCVALPGSARSCVWTPAPTPTGIVVVRVVGRDDQGNTGAGGASYAVEPRPGSDYFTLAPCRLIDTRGEDGVYGGPALAAGTDRVFPLFDRCGIPATAKAISVNMVAVNASSAGHLTLYPADAPVPATSSVNYVAGTTRSNNAVVGLSAAGQLAVRCSQAIGTAHFVLDVTGYFE